MARRKRNDPSDAPIDGDLRRDQVLNANTPRNRDWQPLLLTDEDYALSWRQWGAVKEERGPDSMRPAIEMGAADETGYKVGGLTLYKVPKKVARKRQEAAQNESQQRMSAMSVAVRGARGEFVESNA
jgi:hypothetical protein